MTFAIFCTVTEWDNVDSIKQFAGEDYQKARYYPDDEKYLSAFEEHVNHYEPARLWILKAGAETGNKKATFGEVAFCINQFISRR